MQLMSFKKLCLLWEPKLNCLMEWQVSEVGVVRVHNSDKAAGLEEVIKIRKDLASTWYYLQDEYFKLEMKRIGIVVSWLMDIVNEVRWRITGKTKDYIKPFEYGVWNIGEEFLEEME